MSLKNLLQRTKGIDIEEVDEDGHVLIPTKNCLYKLPQRQDPTEQKSGQINPLNGRNLPTLDPLKLAIFNHYKNAYAELPRTTGVFHPSEISQDSNPCQRKMYFDLGRVKHDVTYVNFTADNRMQRLVDFGTLVHLYVQYTLYMNGMLKDFEVEVVDKKRGVSGSMDGVIAFYGMDDYNKFYEIFGIRCALSM